MIRSVLASFVLSVALIVVVYRVSSIYEERMPERITRIDIHHDRIAYRLSSYATPSMLAIGLEAAKDPPRVLALHDCARLPDFESIVLILREQGYTSFDVVLPADC